jgi:uncharacterized protein DUF4255/carboxypeptidase family protein
MLLELHTTLQRLLYERGQIDPREVDITFEAPTKERIERLTRPTLNLFLFDVQENTDLRQSSFQNTKQNGRIERHMLLRRFDLRYMVSALTTSVEDEHALLWRALLTLVQHPVIPRELLGGELRAIEPPLSTRMMQTTEGQNQFSLWTALGAQPRPALYYIVTAPVDMHMTIDAPLVLTRTARYGHRHGEKSAPESGIQVGGVVCNPAGEPLAGIRVALEGSALESQTNTEGRFVLRGVSSGGVRLRVTRADGSHKIVPVQVPESLPGAAPQPESSYDIVLEPAAQ